MKTFGMVCEKEEIIKSKTLKIFITILFKEMKKLLLLAIVVLGVSAVSFGQLTNTASANATATIKTALTIKKNADLAFGAIGAKTTATTAVMTTGGLRTGSTCDVLAIATGNAAEFEVVGDAGDLFAITFPTALTPLQLTGKPDMTIAAASWTAKIDGAADGRSGNIDSSGKSIVKVGATLSVGASQPKGDYTGTFSVTVNYN